MVTLTFEIISRKYSCALSGMCLVFVPKTKLIGPMVFEEIAIGQTDRVPCAIDNIDTAISQESPHGQLDRNIKFWEDRNISEF